MRPRKILCSIDAPEVQSILRLAETQSKATLGNWALTYAERHILPIYESDFADSRPREALRSARTWFAGEVKLPLVRERIDGSHLAAKEAELQPAAQAAARAAAQTAAIAHTPVHVLGFLLYGVTALVYAAEGTALSREQYDRLAAERCAEMERALRAVAVADEARPARLNWAPMISEGSLFRKSYGGAKHPSANDARRK